MHKIVAVFFNQSGKLDYPFHDSLYYDSYRDFTVYCAERGIDLIIVRGAESYLGNMRFSHGWRFVGNELIDIAEPITVDLIYNKELEHDLRTNPGDLVLNDPEFDRIGRDKWLTAQAFPQLVPPTYRIDESNWREVIDKLPSDKVVLKPISGTEGKGILIVDKATFDLPSLALDRPYIAQAFIDSSAGIPGICEGMHDLRVLLFNGVPKLSFIRQPKQGSFLSNVAQGGHALPVDISQVPQSILQAAATIDAYYQHFTPRFYTADFFMNDNRPYLIETNTRPGFPHPETEGEVFTATFYTELVALFQEAMQRRS